MSQWVRESPKVTQLVHAQPNLCDHQAQAPLTPCGMSQNQGSTLGLQTRVGLHFLLRERDCSEGRSLERQLSQNPSWKMAEKGSLVPDPRDAGQ